MLVAPAVKLAMVSEVGMEEVGVTEVGVTEVGPSILVCLTQLREEEGLYQLKHLLVAHEHSGRRCLGVCACVRMCRSLSILAPPHPCCSSAYPLCPPESRKCSLCQWQNTVIVLQRGAWDSIQTALGPSIHY